MSKACSRRITLYVREKWNDVIIQLHDCNIQKEERKNFISVAWQLFCQIEFGINDYLFVLRYLIQPLQIIFLQTKWKKCFDAYCAEAN